MIVVIRHDNIGYPPRRDEFGLEVSQCRARFEGFEVISCDKMENGEREKIIISQFCVRDGREQGETWSDLTELIGH